MRVLVTGHRGYIGAVMVDVLRHARAEVVGLDCDLYGDCGFGRVADQTPSFDIDIREIEFTDLLSFDAVVHLAGLPDSYGRGLSSRVVEQFELSGALRLAECCKQAQVPRFLYASDCSVYGRGAGTAKDETAVPAPISTVARCKLEAERALTGMADPSFCPVILRCATAYGTSPRMRLDTIVNDFVASATTRARIDLPAEGRAWRSLVHVEDLCRAFAAALIAPDAIVSNQIFNLAAPNQSSRVVDLADLICDLVLGAQRSADGPPGSPGAAGILGFDPENCQVSGARFLHCFPKFAYRWSLEQGIRQMRDSLSAAALSAGLWRSDRYRRLLRLESRIERGELDRLLRSTSAVT